MAGIFVVSGIQDLTAVPGGISDKAGHALAYGALSVFMLRALAGARVTGVTWGRGVLAWIITAAYGVTDEVHQLFVTGRFAAVDDWVADAAGAAIALVIVGVGLAGSHETRGL